MEKIKVSKEYKKAFNHADMICSYMPQELEKLAPFQHESTEYIKGFEDRVRQHRIEMDMSRKFSLNELKQKYGRELNDYLKNQTKGKRK